MHTVVMTVIEERPLNEVEFSLEPIFLVDLPELPSPSRFQRLARLGLIGVAGCMSTLGLAGDTRLPDETIMLHPDSPVTIGNEISIMTANVHFWQGNRGNNFDTFLNAIEEQNPDVVCMQEVLADGEELRLLYEAGYNILFTTTIRYPEVMEPRSGRFGNAVASRSPIQLERVIELPQAHFWSTPRKALVFTIETEEGPLELVDVHFSTKDQEAEQQTEYLYHQIKNTADAACGDFNQDPPTIQAGAMGLMAGGAAAIKSFPAHRPRLSIDHVISNCGVALPEHQRTVFIDSDHLAVMETLNIEACLDNN